MPKQCNRRYFLKTAAGLGSFVFSAALTSCTLNRNRPNILFAFADDWGWPHAGVYGDPTVKTPVFNRIARTGVLFNNAFVSAPSCTPSRGSVLCGQHFWRLGSGANLWSRLPADISLYTDLLRKAGYVVGYNRKGWGPGKYDGEPENPAGKPYNNFKEFLQHRPQDKPFCFWFGSQDPHRPYDPQLRQQMNINPDDVKVPPFLPDSAAVREDIADYYAEVQRFDTETGQLIEMLKQNGELDNTVMVISGDHGMPFPRCKTNLYDSGARVPLAICWPAGLKGGRQINDLISLTDLAPTFLELAGLQIPQQMTGKSLVQMLTSDKQGSLDAHRDAVFLGRERHTPCQEKPIRGGYPMRAIRTLDFLYIRNFQPERWPSGTPDVENVYMDKGWLGDCDNGKSKYYMWANRYHASVKPFYDLAFAKRPEEELYDLKNDPHQMCNVAKDPGYENIKTTLHAKLTNELRQTSDPRVLGNGKALENEPYYGTIPLWPGTDTIKDYKI